MSRLFKTSLAALALGLVASMTAFPALASPGDDGFCAGPANLAQAGTCGDGICDPYVGENKTSCPKDCGAKATATTAPQPAGPTDTPTPTTPTATSTFFPFFVLPTRTPTATSTASPTPSTTPATPTTSLTVTPTGGVPGQQVGCDFVSYESRTKDWQSGYGKLAKEFTPERTDQREVFVCRVPPLQQVCLPIYDGLMEAVNDDKSKIALVDCDSAGQCDVYDGKLTQVDDMLCAAIVVAGDVSCTGGCALAPASPTSLLTPPSFDLSALLANPGVAAPIACVLVAMLIAGIGLLIFVFRRSRRRELPD